MTQLRHISLAFSLAVVTACGGQVGEETVSCEPVQTTVLSRTEVSPLGFAASDVLAFVEGIQKTPLRWADGTSTELTTTFVLSGTVRFHVRDWVDEGSGRESQLELIPGELDCADIVEMTLDMSMGTDDGALAETWEIELQAPSKDSTGFSRELEALTGTLSIDSFKPAGDFDSNRAFLELRLTEAGVSGSIVGQVTSGDAEVVSARSYEIAEFGPPSP